MPEMSGSFRRKPVKYDIRKQAERTKLLLDLTNLTRSSGVNIDLGKLLDDEIERTGYLVKKAKSGFITKEEQTTLDILLRKAAGTG